MTNVAYIIYNVLAREEKKAHRGVAQMVEHHVRDVGAAGSNPVTPSENGKLS